MKDFSSLTRRGQALRLRRLARTALEYYDLPVVRVSLLSNDYNSAFRVDTRDGTPYFLRIGRPRPRGLEENQAETLWLAALHRDTDLRVPEPLPNRQGGLVTTAEAPGVPEPRNCVLFRWITGKDLAAKLSPEYMYQVGVLTTRLHDHALTFRPPQDFSIKTWDTVFYFQEEAQVILSAAYRQYFPPERLAVMQQAIERVQAALDKLFADRRGLRVLHADLHQWNIKVWRGKLSLLDFEDLLWGYPAQDIAITFYYLQHLPNAAELREAFRRGYTSRSAWPEQYPGEIDSLIAGRELMMLNFWIQFTSDPARYAERAERRLRAYLEQTSM